MSAPSVYCCQVESASGLALVSRMGQTVNPNAYVVIQVAEYKFRTNVVQRKCDPVWKEEFHFAVIDLQEVCSLVVKHKRGGPWQDKVLGEFMITVADLDKMSGQDVSNVIEFDLIGLPSPLHSRIKIGLRAQGIGSSALANIALAKQAIESQRISGLIALPRSLQDSTALVSGTISVLSPLGAIIRKLEVFADLADALAAVHPFVQVAWKFVSVTHDAFKQQVELDQNVIDLVETMKNTYKFVDVIKVEPFKLELLEETITNILLQTINSVLFIRKYASRGFGKRFLHALSSEDGPIIDTMSQAFSDLYKELFEGMATQTTVAALHIESIVTDLQYDTKLRKLGAPMMDRAGRATCLPGTRLETIDFISDWVTQFGEQNILWVHGLAGSGKSTLAMTLADLFDQLHYLGACLLFDKENSDPLLFIKALALQLAEFDGRICDAIAGAIGRSTVKLRSALGIQFDTFILRPLLSPSLVDFHRGGPIVIIIDALDQCGNPQSRAHLLEVLRAQLPKLPSCYRIIITSRAVRDIHAAFSSVDTYELDISAEANSDDIVAYLHDELSQVPRERRLPLPQDWPGDGRILALAKRAAGLFVWASTAAIFVRSGQSPDERLETLLNAEILDQAEAALNSLYITALQMSSVSSASSSWDDPTFALEFRTVVGIVITAKIPLTCDAIDGLRGPDRPWPSVDKISILGSVLTFEPHRIRTLHSSFDDFITNLSRCRDPKWHIDLPSHNYDLAGYCLDCLVRYFDAPVAYDPLLSLATLFETLSEDVAYAGIFWLDHICAISTDGRRESIIQRLVTFLRRDLLHWLEILSIVGKSRDAIKMFGRLQIWVDPFKNQSELKELVRDGYRFMQTFADSIEQHPFMVYNSALAFTPTNTYIYRNFYGDYPWVVGGFQTNWPPISHTIAAHKDAVNAVVFSVDDARILSSSDDCSIRTWDAETGAQLGLTLRGHVKSVRSIALLSDGIHVVSASSDGTLRTWNFMIGEELHSLRRTHDAELLSVACSPDGSLIASGSADKNIYLWKAAQIGPPYKILIGHLQAVLSVQFFSNSNHIVSASVDSTVGLWDLRADVTPQLLKGHDPKCSVYCAIISPDESYLASASQDFSIRIWDTETGVELPQSPLWGNEHHVTTVAFSPDGRHIASGSVDRTVRLWDVKTGSQVWKNPRRHAQWVTSIAFSHGREGLRIAAGSGDGNIRVWDASPQAKSSNRNPLVELGTRMWAVAFSPNGKLIASGLTADHKVLVYNPYSENSADIKLKGHTDRIETVVFSPDSNMILSGSQDCTIRLWNVATRQLFRVMSGHTNSVFAVAFSPDGGPFVVSGSDDNTARLWEREGGEIVHILRGHELAVITVALSYGSELLVSGSEDGTVRIWDTKSGTQTQIFSDPLSPGCSILSVVFGQVEGQIIFSLKDGSFRTWDMASQSCTSTVHNFFPAIKQDLRYPLIIRSDGNIEDIRTNKIISRLTAAMSVGDVTASTSCGTAMALWENTAYIYILAFTADVACD